MKRETPPLRIVHVGNHTLPCVGGVENVIWQSAKEQAELGHTVKIMVFDTCSRGEKLPAEETREGVTIMRVPQRGFSFYRIPPVNELLSCAADADIIHIHGVGAWLDILARHKNRLRGKLVLTTHGGFFHTKKRGLLKWAYAHVVLPFSWNQMDGIIYVSASDQNHFSFLPQEKTMVQENGIESAYGKLPLSRKKDGVFLFVGRISSNKRVDQLIETFAMHSRTAPGKKSTLHIVGKDWEGIQSALEKRVTELGLSSRIIFHGEVSDKQKMELFARASYFVSASEYEGFGISVVEAMAAGCIPCVNTIPPFEKFVTRGTGMLVDYSDYAAASSAWNGLVEMPASVRQKKQAAGRKFAQQYEWKKCIAKMVEWYYSLVR